MLKPLSLLAPALLLTAAATCVPVASAQVSAADFLPPARGGTTEIAEPAQVEDRGEVLIAASAGDAMNAAVKANKQALAELAPDADEKQIELGSRFVQYPSGVGVTGTGMAVYKPMPNPTATRIAQRNAFVVAYTKAKQAMVQQIAEMTSEGRTVLTQVSETINSDVSATASEATTVEEKIEQAGQALLKGYVVYEIDEQVDADDVRTVFVSIVSSPKTQSLVMRNGAVQSTASLLEGISAALDEVNAGVVPPVGGRVIAVPTTGETAVIGFGSAIVQDSPIPSAQARLKLTARTISAARARDALVGMIDGDKTMWSVGVPSKTDDRFKVATEYASANDPTAGGDVERTVTDYEQQFLSTDAARTEVQSIRRGTLPPGVQEKHWYDENGHWSHTMVVYYPALSAKAKSFAESMRNSSLKAPADRGDAGSNAGIESNAGTSAAPAGGDARPTDRIDGDVPPLPGGQVTNDEDL